VYTLVFSIVGYTNKILIKMDMFRWYELHHLGHEVRPSTSFESTLAEIQFEDRLFVPWSFFTVIIAVHVVEVVLVVLRGNLPESGMKGGVQRHHGPFSIRSEANSGPDLAKGLRSLIYREFYVALKKTDSQS
jgi:hypothetical protein